MSSPGPLGKLKSYIKRSAASHSQRSQDQSTDSQNGGFNSLLSARGKTMSTNSLPEAVKYRPAINISGAKVKMSMEVIHTQMNLMFSNNVIKSE